MIVSVDVASILALAQQKATDAIKGAGTVGTSKSVDPEVEARKEAKAKERADRNARIIELYQDRDVEHYETNKGANVFDDIAANVGVSKQTVVSVLTESGDYVPRKRHTQEDFAKVKALFLDEGLRNLTEVAERSGFEYSYVRNVAIKLGVDYESNRGKLDPAKIPDMVRLALELEEFAGMSILSIAQYVHNLRREAQGDVQEVNADGTPRKKRGRKSKAELAALAAAENGEDAGDTTE